MSMKLHNHRSNFLGRCLLLVGVVVLCFSAYAEDKPEVSIFCRNGKQIRTLRTEIGSNKICKAMYNRDGAGEKVIGSGLNYDSCVGFLTKVKDNLEKGGWKCRDVKESTTNLESPSSN